MLLLVMLHAVITIAWLSAASMVLMFLHLMIMMSRSRVIPQKGVRRRTSSSEFLCNRGNFLYFGVDFLMVAAFLLGWGMRWRLFAEAGSQDVDKCFNDDLA